MWDKERAREYSKEYYRKNKDKWALTGERKEAKKEYMKKWRAENAEHRREYQRKWVDNNRGHLDEYQARKRDIRARQAVELRNSDPGKRIHHAMSNSVYTAIKENKSGRKWEDLLGYTIKELKLHLEALFQPGMSWDNYGEWHIDHITPKSWFFANDDDIDSVKLAWSLYNLQPMWASQNYSKSNRYAGGGALS